MAGKLRHLGISCQDPQKTAEFYMKAFGLRKIGELHPDHVGAAGIYLTDGELNITIIKFKTDEYAGDLGKDFVGLHHIGFHVEDHKKAREAIETAGGKYMWPGGLDHQKYQDVDGNVIEVTVEGFVTEPSKVSKTNTGGMAKATAKA